MKRDRKLIVGALVGTIAAGLASRVFAASLPAWLAGNAGDALWSVAVYLVVALAFPAARPVTLTIATLLVSFAVEFSQMVRASWLVSLRENRLARLLLGTTFVWADLPRYTLGTIAAFIFDILVLNRFHRLKRESRV